MQKKVTVTIGIPAYNEEHNIALLLQDVLKQKTYNCLVEKILVLSDGSVDKTIPQVASVQSEKIQLVSFVTRKGLAFAENEIISRTISDILVILNADTRIPDEEFVEKLTAPIRSGQADLTSCAIVEITPKTFMERVLSMSMQMKETLFRDIHNGDNVYTCHGPARAFAKSLYTKLRFKNSVGEDAYSYLFAKSQGYSYQYVASVSLLYKLPHTLADHMAQSLRFAESRRLYVATFGETFVTSAYAISLLQIGKAALLTFLRHPVLSISYAAIFLYSTGKRFAAKSEPDLWRISNSSKIVSVQK